MGAAASVLAGGEPEVIPSPTVPFNPGCPPGADLGPTGTRATRARGRAPAGALVSPPAAAGPVNVPFGSRNRPINPTNNSADAPTSASPSFGALVEYGTFPLAAEV